VAKPDTQTVAQMAATIASGFAAKLGLGLANIQEKAIISQSVYLARAIVVEVERAEQEEEK
jgi:hypothetical protein